MRVLIIGGSRFTGPHVARGLIELGHEVTLFHRGKTARDLPSGVEQITGEKAELASHRDTFERLSADVVIHMLAFTLEDAQTFVETFRGITARAVVISSGDVYLAYGRMRGSEPGPVEPLPLNEDSRLRTRLSPEGEAYNKTAVEAIVASEPQLPATIIRYPAVYGPGDLQRRFSDYFRRIADQRSVLVIGEGEAGHRFTHAYSENAAHAVVLAATNQDATGRVYNIGEPDTPTGIERVKRIAAALDWDGEVVAVPDASLPPHLQRPPINLEQHLVMDSARIRSELGYTEIVDEDEAIRRTYVWQLENPPPDALAPDYAAEDRLLAGR